MIKHWIFGSNKNHDIYLICTSKISINLLKKVKLKDIYQILFEKVIKINFNLNKNLTTILTKFQKNVRSKKKKTAKSEGYPYPALVHIIEKMCINIGVNNTDK